jgi:HSP20 family protein
MLNKYYSPEIRLFTSIFDELFEMPVTNSMVKTPVHDVIENDNEYQIDLLLAGIKKEDISINVEKDILTINAERKENKDTKYNRKETFFGKYKRSFTLPEDVDKENISASLEDGILKITIPKFENKASVDKKIIEIK